MPNWTYLNKSIKSIDDMPRDKSFVVYRINFTGSKEFYIGCKQIFFDRRVKLSKKRANELYSGKGGKKKFERKITESDWAKYTSSSKVVNEMLDSGKKATFKFIGFYETKREMLLQEAKLIIDGFLKEDEKMLNGWLSIKVHKLKKEV